MIPVNEPSLGPKEQEYAAECVRTGWISSAGRFIQAFEKGWAEYCGRRYGIAVANGTVAIEAALESLDLQPGDEVILPSFTIVSCAQSVVYAGGKPVLVDADPETWTMDPAQVEAKVTSRTRAIMPVHIYGHPCDMDPILDIARRRGLKVVEDAAEAHGALYKGRRCGGFGDLSCFSFYANKIITTGEGGMVLTDDPELAAKLEGIRNLCFEKERRFLHHRLGHNFRLTNIQAAIGTAQLERVDELLASKRRMGALYNGLLAGTPGLQLPVERPWAFNVYWMYGLVLDEATGFDAVSFAQRLKELGVETRPFFLGMHAQPAFHDLGLFRGESYPVTDRLAKQGLYLPSGMTLTEAQIRQVAQAVKTALAAPPVSSKA